MGSLSLSLRSLAGDGEDVGNGTDLLAAAQPAADAESYTMDREILFMRKKASAGGGPRKVVVVRGDKAETTTF